jgi:hypothetical protein
VLALALDSPRWDLEGNARRTSVQGRDCLMLDGAAAIVKDFEMRDGVIDVDVATWARRGFFGLQFRVVEGGANSEWVYLRQHKSGLPDAMQLAPQPGMQVVYARAAIDSDREQVKKLAIGYGDDVSVFLNGAIVYRGRSAQNFRDPAFLGIVDVENDAVYLPLRKGSNELVLAVSELGGGWGFVCRPGDVAP